jgi:hypothetical protein
MNFILKASTILKPVEVDYLYNMLGVASNHQLTLLYRATRDGMSSSAFHSICDGIPNIWLSLHQYLVMMIF